MLEVGLRGAIGLGAGLLAGVGLVVVGFVFSMAGVSGGWLGWAPFLALLGAAFGGVWLSPLVCAGLVVPILLWDLDLWPLALVVLIAGAFGVAVREELAFRADHDAQSRGAEPSRAPLSPS
jgi:hypothetical protein